MNYLLPFLFLFSSLSAVTITIDKVGGYWDNVSGSPVNLTGEGSNQINWGKSTGSGQSGYRFDASSPTLYPVNIGTTFTLGNFTHINQPITGGSITGARLNTTLDLTIDGVALKNLHFAYDFLHTETPNIKGSCPAGSSSVCDDIVKSTDNVLMSDVFNINGVDYTVSILGFDVNGKPLSEFLTKEGKINVATLRAVITKATVGVPDVNLYLSLGAFLLVVSFIAYRRKQAIKQS